MFNSAKKTTRSLLRTLILTGICCGSVSAMAQQASYAVAGLQPDRRPKAPKVVDIDKGGHWYAKALTGVEQPYPWSLQFLNVQGNWHTPFTVPGMTGKYDMRGWHR